MARKFIDNYKEFGAKSNESVRSHVSDAPIPEKERILRYLKSFPNYGTRCSTLYDYVEDVLYSPTVFSHYDGTYYWDDEEVYHFEKYNMKLEENFIQWVLQKGA